MNGSSCEVSAYDVIKSFRQLYLFMQFDFEVKVNWTDILNTFKLCLRNHVISNVNFDFTTIWQFSFRASR